jgi:transcriptional regulator with XRE-family HTH domain
MMPVCLDGRRSGKIWPSMKPETLHIIQILRSAMRVLGYTNREIESRLHVSGGYLTRLFNGTMELRFEHIVDISRAMGLDPEEIFHLAYPHPRNPPTEAAQRLRETFAPRLPELSEAPAGGAGKPEPAATGIEQEMERMMRKVLSRFFSEFVSQGTRE